MHVARDQYLATLSIDVVGAVSSLINIGNAAGDDQSDDEHEESDDDEPIEEQDQEETALSDMLEIISHWRS